MATRPRTLVVVSALALLLASCASSPEDTAATTSTSPDAATTETTAAPATTAPETTAPETTAPETTAPATTAPAPRDPSLLYLPTAATIGQTANQVVTSTNEVILDAPGEDEDSTRTTSTSLTVDVEVTEVEPGFYVALETIRDASIEIDGTDTDPEGDAMIREAFAEIAGTMIAKTMGDDGVELDREVLNGAALSEIAFGIVTTPSPRANFGFDPAGIAVGDTWTVEVSGAELGLPLSILYQVELVDFDGVNYEISILIDQDVSALIAEVGSSDLRATGSGSITGNTTNPLMTSSELTFSIDGTITDQDGEVGTLTVLTTTSSVASPL